MGEVGGPAPQAAPLRPNVLDSDVDFFLHGNVEAYGLDVLDPVEFLDVTGLACTGIDEIAVRCRWTAAVG